MHEQQAQDVPRSHPRAATQLTSFAADGNDSVRANVDHACRLYRSNLYKSCLFPRPGRSASLPDSSLPSRRLITTKCEACFTRRAFIESSHTIQHRSYIVQRGTLLPQCCLSRENGGHERPCSTCSLQSFPSLWPLSPSSP
jgi:hypothetical protein